MSSVAQANDNVFDLDSWRRERAEQRAREAALDWLDQAGWCACWTTPGWRHRVTGTGGLA